MTYTSFLFFSMQCVTKLTSHVMVIVIWNVYFGDLSTVKNVALYSRTRQQGSLLSSIVLCISLCFSGNHPICSSLDRKSHKGRVYFHMPQCPFYKYIILEVRFPLSPRHLPLTEMLETWTSHLCQMTTVSLPWPLGPSSLVNWRYWWNPPSFSPGTPRGAGDAQAPTSRTYPR